MGSSDKFKWHWGMIQIKSFFPSQNFVKPMQFYCFQFFSYKSPRTFTCGDLPQNFRNVPTHARGSRWGGVQYKFLAQLSSFTNAVLQQNSYWFGVAVWFLVFTRFIKITIRSDSLIVPWQYRDRNSIVFWQFSRQAVNDKIVIRHIPGLENMIVWYFM